MQYTPDGFGQALSRLSKAVEQREAKAIEARAKVVKRGILESAASVGPIGGVRPNWVKYEIVGSGRNAAAKVRLRGGFANLTQRGSWKHAGGWTIQPKATRRATRARRTRQLGRGVAGPIESSGQQGVIANESTGFGPVAHATHTPLRPRPFFRAGIDLSRKASLEAYRAVIHSSLSEALK